MDGNGIIGAGEGVSRLSEDDWVGRGCKLPKVSRLRQEKRVDRRQYVCFFGVLRIIEANAHKDGCVF